jgi:putative salt-induced outer membrane protein YdiY
LGLWLLAMPTLGDVVRMKSGDVVSGKIEKIDDDELTIDPPFSDPIEIKLKYIAKIETTRPVKVTFKDGRETTGLVELDEQGNMQVKVTSSRWEREHADDPWILRENRGTVPAPGTAVPLGDLETVQDLEVAFYRYEAHIGLGLNAATGNTDSSALDFDASVKPYWGPNSLNLAGQIDRRESNGKLDAKNWQASLGYERDLPGKWFAFLGNLNESDPFQELDLRTAVSIGGGYRFFETDPTHLSVAMGPAYVRENYQAPSPDRSFAAAVWRFDFSRDFFGDDVTAYHNHFLVKALTEKQLLVNTVQGIKLDLFDDLDLKLEFEWDYASDPAPGVSKKNDLRYIVKLDYSFEGDETDWLH